MPIQKISFEETLKKFVIEPLLCTGCASCVISCPFNCLDYVDSRPKIVSECKSCGICAQICPRFNLSIPSLERFVFGRERDVNEIFGIYKRIVIAQTTSGEIMKVCQDGGVVTSLLTYALEEGIIKGAAISGESGEEPLKAVPKLALSKNNIIKCSGTRYTYSPNMLALKDSIHKKIGKIAFVGTPCHIHALRRIQMLPLKKYADAIGFALGLFCSESFTYDGLVKRFIQERMNIEPREVAKINIKGKLLLKMKNGDIKALPLKEIKEFSCIFCNVCPDFSAELADISVGGLGLEGWSFTIIRTEVGDEMFRKAESKGLITTKPVEDKRLIDLLIKMSIRKQENSVKSALR